VVRLLEEEGGSTLLLEVRIGCKEVHTHTHTKSEVWRTIP